MRPFHFLDNWSVPAPVRRVWEVLLDPGSLASNWKDVTMRDTSPIRTLRVGSVIDWEAQSPLRAKLRFTTRVTRMDSHRRIDLDVSGDLAGFGVLEVGPDAPDGDAHKCRIRIQWNVVPTNRSSIVLLMVPGGRSLLKWAHNKVANQGRIALTTLATRAPSTPGL